MKRIILFANGKLPNLESARALLRPDDFLLGVDAGARHILALGLTPRLILGDFDSLTEDELYDISDANIPIQQYPSDKNETDLELALDYAIEAGYREIVIIAALGDRLDQTLGNLSLLTDIRLAPLDVRLDDGAEEVFVCRNQAEVKGRSGEVVSLIPWGGEVTGVVTQNLKWPLYGETLHSSKTRGISNEMLGEAASIKISTGLLLIVHRRTDN